MQANALAPLALILWFPFTVVLFMRIRPSIAASISIVGAGIFLPSGYVFDFRGLPEIGRETIASLACVLAILVANRKLFSARKPLQGAESIALVLIAAGFGTVLTNTDSGYIGTRWLPPLKLWDAIAVSADAVFFYGIPFYLGRILFRHPRDLRILLMVLAGAGLLYSIPILWEVRMSPGLHHFVYGYHPASFGMARRELFFGWRPMVWVGHGLALSMFVLATALAAATLRRGMPERYAMRFLAAAGYLSLIVLLCNSVGTIVYAMAVVPLAAFASKGLLRRVLILAILLVFLYPALRATNVFPTDGLVKLAASYSQDRADSLEYRFDNEDILLARARERVLFGWGGYARGRVYDPISGKDLSTTDGYWIIVFGSRGVIGFLAIFGMMLLPVVGAVRATAKRTPPPETYLVLGTALLVAICAIDLLPNGAPTIRTVFSAGALAGALQGWRRASRRVSRSAGTRSDSEVHRRKKKSNASQPQPSSRPGESPRAVGESLATGLLGDGPDRRRLNANDDPSGRDAPMRDPGSTEG